MENKQKLSIQEYLSLSYIFLIVLGLLSDVIFYSLIGLNILDYVDILDVIISPISILLSDILLFIVTVIVTVLFYLLYRYVTPWYHKKYRHTSWYQKTNNVEKLDKLTANIKSIDNILKYMGLLFFCFFFGFRLGSGRKLSEKIAGDKLTYKEQITFADNTKKDVHIIGQTSQYIFFVEKKQRDISIVPISPNIKMIQHLSDK